MCQLGATPTVTHIDQPQWKGKVKFSASAISDAAYQRNLAQIRIEDNDIRYSADSFRLDVPGAPQSIKRFSGISRPESWGRWSNANLAPEVKIEYVDPLPAKFDLVITARAYGANAHLQIPVRVSDQQQLLSLGENFSTHTLHFDNTTATHELIIAPPEPQLSNISNITGQDPRKLGIGMVGIKIVPQS